MKQQLLALLRRNKDRLQTAAVSASSLLRLADELIANGVTVQRWIPVEERLPTEDDADERGNVLVIHPKGHKNFWRWDFVHSPIVTHWMPLPEPPGKDVSGNA